MREKVEVKGCTLPIYMYIKENITYYEFDSRECEPPIPMANALRVLDLIDNETKVMVMINMQEPTGLYTKMQDYFSWSVTPLENGDVRVEFKKRV
ncbi:MAG: DUF2249 domain-containing protein [Campylobacterota bacterium]|nr:DUF2249 domain-containing protein [Campylobacterota bacterium]